MKVFIELFSGCGNLSKAVRALGFPVISADILLDDIWDLSNRETYLVLLGWIESGLVLGLWCGTPCSTFSQARRAPPGSQMPGRLRDQAHPRGLPGLSERDKKAVKMGTLLADRAACLLQAAARRRIPCGEENPQCSLLWSLRSRVDFMNMKNVVTYCVDYCAFGAAYRARTRLVCAHFKLPDEVYDMKCKGKGVCTFSGVPHVVLTGSSANAFLTRMTSAYPIKMCKMIAKAMTMAYVNFRQARLWNLLR